MINITAKTPRGAASATYKALKAYAKKYDIPDSDLILKDPVSSNIHGFGHVWSILWESGPSDWGLNLSMGESMFAGEFGNGKPEINLMGSNKWYCECYWSFTLLFTPS